MFYFLAVLLALAAVYALVIGLVRADPRDIARAVRILAPATLIVLALIFAALGRPGVGVIFALAAAGLIARAKRSSAQAQAQPVLRSPWLELELAAAPRKVGGTVLAGEHEGKSLESLTETQALQLYYSLAGDADSRALMEAYLDSRIPGWRDNANPDADLGQRSPPGPGAMADEEAYQILGLQPGAGTADIRKAHRSLTQRMRGGGGAALLLSRIDKARDVLLARHD